MADQGFPKVFVVNGPDVADYDDLVSRPSINTVVLEGDKTGDDLGLLDKVLLDAASGIPTLDAGSKLQMSEIPLATEEEAEAGTVETGLMTPLRTKNAIDALVPTMTGATDLLDGAKGYAPAPAAGDEGKFLAGDGTWKNQPPLALAETEFDTCKVWIDTRPIFGVVVNFGALPNSTEKRVASGVTAGATVLSVNGYSKDTTDVVATIPLPYSSVVAAGIPMSAVQVYHDDATQEVVVLTSIDRSAYTETYIVLEYVKAV